MDFRFSIVTRLFYLKKSTQHNPKLGIIDNTFLIRVSERIYTEIQGIKYKT